MQQFTVTLQPVGRRVEVDAGTNLLEAAQKAGVDLVASCGGIGICGTCKVRIAQGQVTPPTLTEQEELGKDALAAGFRLACQTVPLEDVRLDIPRESLAAGQQMQVEGRDSLVALKPAVVAVDLDLEPPSLEDLRSDQTRVNEALAERGFKPLQASMKLFYQLSSMLRSSNWKARLALRPAGEVSELVAVLPLGAPIVGLAMDMGSTKLALYLVNLETGVTLVQTGVMNPQIAFGEDVVSRITYANRSEENRKLLQTRLLDAINQSTAELCQQHGLTQMQIVDVTAVGNTAMHHFFCGLPVEPLGKAPYVAVVSSELYFNAEQIGLTAAPGAQVYLPPNIAGYVGADHVSALLASHSYANGRTNMVVDIGTNTEISLTYRGRVLSCSCASGPAFEGAHIHDGMRAAAGAVERVHIQDGQIRPVTIAGQSPVGICGSGILNAVSEMLDAAVIDSRGVLNNQSPFVRSNGSGRAEFLMVPAEQTGHGKDIVVTRKDVNEIQLAKGAIRAGLDILLQEAGIPADAIEDFIIAGAFGTHLDLGSALRVGMFPTLPLDRYHQVGNAAGVGARQMLLSTQRRRDAVQIASGVEYVELTTHANFTPQFVDAMYF